MGSIIKVPRDTVADYDYIAFSFDGKHSYEDFGIYRVSDGKEGYDESLVSAISDATVEVPGMDGQYFFGTQHKNRVFNIKFAFDSLTEAKLQEMKSWLSGKKIRDLWFDETPYKVYSAKVTGAATITATPFADARNGRVYKGTGTVEFTSYYPYPHTPRWIQHGDTQLDGKLHNSYSHFSNFQSIQDALPGYEVNGVAVEGAYGDLPFTFVANLSRVGYDAFGQRETQTGQATKTYKVSSNKATQAITITVPSSEIEYYSDYRWDSRQGEVSALDSRTQKRVLVLYSGKAACALEPCVPTTENVISLEYDYWYY